MRTLVINTAFLGDIVFTLPLIECLGLAGHRVDLVARPPFGELAAGVPGLAAVHRYDKRGGDRGPGALWRLGRRLRAERYDLVLGAHPSTRSGLLAAATGAPRRIGWGPVGYHRRLPRGPRFVEDALALAEAAGVPTPVRAPCVRARAEAPPVPPGAVALVPGARWATKRWPRAHWATLACALRRDGVPLVWLGSAGERALCDPAPGDLDACGLSLPATATVLAGCRAAVGGDSGLLHLARAVGVPTLMLFGPTDAARLPPDPGRRVLTVPGLGCRPCSPHGPARCPLGHHHCLTALSPAGVRVGLQGLPSG